MQYLLSVLCKRAMSLMSWNFKAAEAIQSHIFHCHLMKYATHHNSQFPPRKGCSHNFMKCLKIASSDLQCPLSITEGIFRHREFGFIGSPLFVINYERELLEGRKALMRWHEKKISQEVGNCFCQHCVTLMNCPLIYFNHL